MELKMESIGSVSGKIKLFSGPGTRQWPRFNIANIPLLREVRSGAGSRLRVVNISRGGALLRTKRRLMRGTRVQLRVETSDGTISLSASVLRSLVSSSKGIPRYQAAVVFDRPLRILDHYSKTAMDPGQTVCAIPPRSNAFPPAGNPSFPNSLQSEDLLMIAASWALNLQSEQYAGMREELELNDWTGLRSI